MDELLAKHRKEKKDLQNRITGMKKQANKSQRKEVNAKCELLLLDLTEKHQQEINDLNNSQQNSENSIISNEKTDLPSNDGKNTDSNNNEITPEFLLKQLSLENEQNSNNIMNNTNNTNNTNDITPKKRRNRQKERLAKRDAEIAKIKLEAQLEANEQPNLQKIEQDSIDQLCTVLKLKQFDIKPDGHCLFASILDQLKYRKIDITNINTDDNINQNIMDNDKSIDDYTVYDLRKLSCNYISNNKDDFIPYLFDENTMTLQDIDKYIEEMSTTAKWGGEIEILALSKIFNCPISILISGQSKHLVNESGENSELKLVYYKHSYSLGEHYNSLHDL